MMKYEAPEVEIVRIEENDIIRTSGLSGDDTVGGDGGILD